MPAIAQNFTIEQGATFRRELTWYEDLEQTTPKDLTGYTGRMQIRATISSGTVLHSLTTENGGISLDPLDGGIHLFISDEATAGFAFTTAVYDLEMEHTSSGDVTRLIKGTITVDPEVTRE